MFIALNLQAASFNTITLTFTNIPTNGCTFTVIGNNILWTNAPLNSTTWIQTNGIAGSATNLTRRLGAQYPQLRTQQTNSTNVIIAGSGLTVSIAGNYGYLTTNTVLQTNSILFTLPWSTQFETNRTNNAEEILWGLDRYPRTNAFRADSQALTNFAGLTNAQTLTRKTLTAPTSNGGTNSGAWFTNVVGLAGSNATLYQVNANVGTLEGFIGTNWVRLNVNLAVITNLLSLQTVASNVALQRITSAWGNVGNLTNGFLSGFGAINFTVTNFSSPGTGANSQQIGSGADASGSSSIAIGVNATAAGAAATVVGATAEANGDSGSAFGNGATAGFYGATAVGTATEALGGSASVFGIGARSDYSNSTAIGYSAEPTTTNQVRIGTSAEHVSIPGEIRDIRQTNSLFRGTNTFNGEVSHAPRVYSAAISGYVSALNLGTNSFVRITGASGAATNASFTGGYAGLTVKVHATNPGRSFVLLDHSSIGSPDSTEQINLGITTGGLVNMTNNPAAFQLTHDGTEWILDWHSR